MFSLMVLEVRILLKQETPNCLISKQDHLVLLMCHQCLLLEALQLTTGTNHTLRLVDLVSLILVSKKRLQWAMADYGLFSRSISVSSKLAIPN